MEGELNIENALFTTLKNFVNEIELSFDYISESTRENLKTKITELEENGELVKDLNNYLSSFAEKICKVQFAQGKLKGEHYSFLKNINLFGVLSFEEFKNENKSTKRSLIHYLYSFYILSSASENNEEAIKLVQDMVKSAKQQEDTTNPESQTTSSPVNLPKDFKKMQQKLRKNKGAMNEMNNLMSQLMSNKEIMSIATDISKEFQNKKIDPNQMLSSIMSGNMNAPEIKNMFDTVSNKLEEKINDGSIDKEELENQANSLLSKVGSLNLGELLK